MAQEHKVPTQKEVDAYIDSAKALRHEVLTELCAKFFHLPVNVLKSVASARVDGQRQRAAD